MDELGFGLRASGFCMCTFCVDAFRAPTYYVRLWPLPLWLSAKQFPTTASCRDWAVAVWEWFMKPKTFVSGAALR